MPIKKNILLILLLTNAIKSLTSNNQCEKIRGAGSPGNIFHEYFKQIYGAMEKKGIEEPISIISMIKNIKENVEYKFIFKLKLGKRLYYIGLVSHISPEELLKKNPKHVIINFIQSTDIKDVQKILEIYSMNNIKILKCPFNLKTEFWNFVHEKAIIDSTKRKKTNKKIIKKKKVSKKKKVFYNFNLLKKKKKKIIKINLLIKEKINIS